MQKKQRKQREVANLGQKEANLEKLSKIQMQHMRGDKLSACASRLKAKIVSPAPSHAAHG
jgi:hypothetical protein